MRMYRLMMGLVLILGLATAATAAETPDPQEIADHCIAAMEARATRCVANVEADAAEAVERIETLLDEGKIHAAYHAAKRWIERVHDRGRSARGDIRDRAKKCVHRLLRLEAPHQAQRVKDAAEAAAREVRESVGDAVELIVEALPEPPDGE